MIQLQTRIGPLDCHVVQDGDSPAPPHRLVLLCHGFGAPGDDLVPVGHELLNRMSGSGVQGPTRFVFPQAPLELEGFGDSRAWWRIDFDRLAAARADPSLREQLEREVPAGLAESRRMLMATLEELLRQTDVPLSRTYLGGFSQGAMITTDVTLRLEEAPAGLAVLSGRIVAKDEWTRRAPTRRGLRVFQTHGRFDPLLTFDGAEELRDLLTASGLNVEFHPFDGVHTIGLETLKPFTRFLT